MKCLPFCRIPELSGNQKSFFAGVKYLCILFLLGSFQSTLLAQNPTSEVPAESIIFPFDLSRTLLSLEQAPMESEQGPTIDPLVMELPMPDGSFRSFEIVRNNLMDSDFEAAFPTLRTFSMWAQGSRNVQGRLTVSTYGVHATIFAENGQIVIKPLDPNNPELHNVQLWTDAGDGVVCGSEDIDIAVPPKPKKDDPLVKAFTNGSVKITYRMAIATTGEYYQLHGSSIPGTQAAVTAVINALEAIYERDLAVNFTLLTPFIYTNPNTDPFIAGYDDRPCWAAAAVGANFGVDTYDIGHVVHGIGFGDWGGGVVGGNMCRDNNACGLQNAPSKAAGWTSLPGFNPVGDLQVFAHEVGHQFSLPHTWNGLCVVPSPNQHSEFGAYEIGGGSTIMSYKNVCAPNGFQNQNLGSVIAADAYYHAYSIETALAHIANNPSCGIISTTGNTAPVMDASPCNPTYTLPIDTPFKLTGSYFDADGDQVYYCWEQYDEDGPGRPTQGKIGIDAANDPLAPLFRSYPPTDSPTRYFPSMDLILANDYTSNFEPLPKVARDLNFRLTGRDYNPAGGGVDSDDILITVNANGPFEVTAPNTAVNLTAGNTTNVTWDLNGINFLSEVNIKLSIDGGMTYPYTLASDVAVSGTSTQTETVTILANVPGTTTARIMVESSDADCFVFFDISNVDFTITAAGCLAPSTVISPDNAVVYEVGDPGLNLGLSNNLGSTVTSFSSTITTSNPLGNLNVLDQAGTGCFQTNSVYLNTHFITVNTTGIYEFSTGGQGGVILALYTAPYNGSNCTNFVTSNAQFNGASIGGVTMNPTLTAGQLYVLQVSNFNTTSPAPPFTYNITFPNTPVGAIIYDGLLNPTGYNYNYILTFPNGIIGAISGTSDFTSVGAGNFTVYGVSYDGSNPPATWVGINISALQNNNCVRLSSNSKSVTVVNAGELPSISISGNPSNDEGNCYETNFNFTLTRTGNLDYSSTVQYAVSGAAVDGADFRDGVLPMGTIEFLPGATTKTLTIYTERDNTVEPDEAFTVTLSNPLNGTLGTATASGTIINDDPFVSGCSGIYCTASQTLGTPGDQFIQRVSFGLISNGSSPEESLPSGYTDYTCLSNEVTRGCTYPIEVNNFWSPMVGDQCKVWFDWNGNGVFTDAGEEYTLTGSGNSGTQNWNADIAVPATASLGSTRMRVRISNGTPSPCGTSNYGETEDYCVSVLNPNMSILDGPQWGSEGNSGASPFNFIVRRQCASNIVSSATWTVSSTEANGADFVGGTFPSGTVTFNAGELEKTITVNVNGDTDLEEKETFFVTLTNPVNAVLVQDVGDATIGPGDGVSLGIQGNPEIAEGNSGTTIFSFDIIAGGWNFTPSTITWTVTGTSSNPADASDFVGGSFPTGMVTFPGTPNPTPQTISVEVNGDTNFEQNEEFTVTLSNPVNGYIIYCPPDWSPCTTAQSQKGTILNDDGGTTGPSLSITGPAPANEGNSGMTAFTFTVSRSGSTTNASSASWAVTGSGANQANGADFSGGSFPSGTVTFPAGSTTSQTITVNVNGDTDVEMDEGFTVTLSSPTNATLSTPAASTTILNDDTAAVPSLAITGPAPANEGNSGMTAFNFTVNRTGSTASASSASWAVTGSGANQANGADFSGGSFPSGTVTFPAGSATSQTITVNVNGDTDVEMDEGFTVTLSSPTNATLSTPAASTTILNDDTAAVPSLAITGPAPANEGNSGMTAFNFTVNRTGSTASASSASWAVTGSGANQANGVDFSGGNFPSGTVTFPAGSATSQTITVNVNGDTDVEMDEGFTVTLSMPTNATLGTPAASTTILNDDSAGVGCGGVYCVADHTSWDCGNPFEFIENVTFNTINNTTICGGGYNDYSGMSTTVQQGATYALTVTNGAPDPNNQCLAWFDFNDDGDFEDAGEEFILMGSGTNNTETWTADIPIPAGATIGTTGMRVRLFYSGATPPCGTVQYGEAEDYCLDVVAPPALAIVAPNSGNEGDAGPTAFTFTVNRTGSTSSASSASWAVTGSGTNQANAADFDGGAFPSGTVNFAAGSTSSETITVNVNGDTDVEMDEGFTVTLSNPTNATLGTAAAATTILNDDVPGVGCGGVYCAADHTNLNCNVPWEYISNVTFNTINNTTTCGGGYNDYSGMSTTTQQGATYTLTVTNGGPITSNQCYAWFDFNGDGDFEDVGEEFALTGSGTNNTEIFTADIAIPAGASLGTTGMRIRLYDSPATTVPCGTIVYGETEDYCLNITSGTACPPTLTVGGTVSSNTYQASMDLTLDGTVPAGNTVILKGGNSVEISAGSEIELGAVFEILIENCGSIMAPEGIEEEE